MINFFIYANLSYLFTLKQEATQLRLVPKKGFLGEFCIKVDIFDGLITAHWAKIG